MCAGPRVPAHFILRRCRIQDQTFGVLQERQSRLSSPDESASGHVLALKEGNISSTGSKLMHQHCGTPGLIHPCRHLTIDDQTTIKDSKRSFRDASSETAPSSCERARFSS